MRKKSKPEDTQQIKIKTSDAGIMSDHNNNNGQTSFDGGNYTKKKSEQYMNYLNFNQETSEWTRRRNRQHVQLIF
ncbi:hypothetical protein ACP70R_018574 [Stipagrostis hirtigluma subsp. patula]